jgi:FlaG/FlaF family flagellin (archaellin)
VAITTNYIQNGWGIGTGFMDEDCRSSHSAYCGTGSGNVTINLTGIPANVQADINALTKDTASYYSSTMDSTVQAWAATHGFVGRIPNLGPTTLGTWTAPPDRYVLQGFAGNVDAWSYGGQGTFTQAELDYVNANMGDVALIEGE